MMAAILVAAAVLLISLVSTLISIAILDLKDDDRRRSR